MNMLLIVYVCAVLT